MGRKDTGHSGQDRIFDLSDNVVQPFQLETSELRGRIVRLGGVLDDILNPHGYPVAISQILGETVTLCALLSSMLKYEGIFTLQTQGDGPVSMLIADMTTAGGLRGCAAFNEERLQKASAQLSAFSDELGEGSDNHLAQLLGKGHMAFTVDQGSFADRYQGIVELKGSSLVECVQHYFNQSEQIGTGIKLAVGRRGKSWRAAGIMLQHMPEHGKNPEGGLGNVNEDDWRRAMILMGSCTEEEMLSPGLAPQELLFRLFHEEGVRVFTPVPLAKACRCSPEKVESILMMMSADDREHMTVDGKITMTCEFCSRDFVFDPHFIARKIKQAAGDTSRL